MVSSIFSTYSQGENRVTSSIIQVLQNLPVNVVERFLEMFTQDDEGSVAHSSQEPFFRFKNQPKGERSVPDAEISAKFSVLIETKVKPNSVRKQQLEEHLRLAQRGASLVYLTPDHSCPSILKDKDVTWKNFQNVYDLIDELIKEPTLIMSERDQFLLRNLQTFFQETGLLPIEGEVVVVAASKTAWSEYKEFGIYVCQAGRSFKESVELIGFYNHGEIHREIASIKSKEDHLKFPKTGKFKDMPEISLNAEFIAKLDKYLAHVDEEYKSTNQEEDHPRRDKEFQVFDLSRPRQGDKTDLGREIKNNLKSENNKERGVAYTQGQRYTTLDRLKSAEKTSDLV